MRTHSYAGRDAASCGTIGRMTPKTYRCLGESAFAHGGVPERTAWARTLDALERDVDVVLSDVRQRAVHVLHHVHKHACLANLRVRLEEDGGSAVALVTKLVRQQGPTLRRRAAQHALPRQKKSVAQLGKHPVEILLRLRPRASDQVLEHRGGLAAVHCTKEGESRATHSMERC